MRRYATLMLLCAAFAAQAENENYCQDAQTNAQWQSMLAKDYSKDSMVVLFALRDGLCRLVEAKVITLDRASQLFEIERERVVAEAREHNEGLREKPL